MVEANNPAMSEPEAPAITANPTKYACGKCRKVMFTEDKLTSDHTSKVKSFHARDNKVR